MPVAEPDRDRRPRWWHPSLPHAAQRNVAGAIYGLILATSVIAVSRASTPDNAGIAAVTVIVTAGVFWLAHVYAGVLALGLRGRTPPWAEVRDVIDEEWPLVQSGIIPTAILLLGPLGILADATAQDAALVACLLELALTGAVVAWVAGSRGILVALSGAVALSFGVVVVALKILVH
jgi:hypothetical protein